MNDPNVRNRVESSYIEQISEIVDEIRSNFSVSKEIIASIVYILHKYYGTLFSQINMKDSIDGSISSYDLCVNYYNCKIARDNLDEWIKVQETRREQNKR
jgi:hypothetical protein